MRVTRRGQNPYPLGNRKPEEGTVDDKAKEQEVFAKEELCKRLGGERGRGRERKFAGQRSGPRERLVSSSQG